MNSSQDPNHLTNSIHNKDPDFQDLDMATHPGKDKYLENASTNYFVNDYNVNDIPENNPLQSVISEFVKRRMNYVNHKSKKDHQANSGMNVEPELVKPTLEHFYKAFQD